MSLSILYWFFLCRRRRLIAMSADKVVSKDPTKWTLNLLKDNCYEWTESGSIADIQESYLLLKASLFVGIIDLILPHRPSLHSQSFGASTSWAWESCGIVTWRISQLVHDQHISETSLPPLVVSEELFLLMDEVRCKQADWGLQCFLCTPCVLFF